MNKYLPIYKKIFFFAISSIIITAISVVLFSANKNVSAASSGRTVKATFNTPLPLYEFANAAKRYGLKITELYYVQGDIQGGYTVQKREDIDSAMNNFSNAHNTFLELAVAKTNENISRAANADDRQQLLALLNQLTSAQSKIKERGLQINSIETDDEQSLEGFKNAGFIKKYNTDAEN